MALPDAATKLRMVLDYLPCEACLAQPVEDQDLLCTVCARLDRQIAVRVGTRTSVLIERPSPPEEAVVIPPAPVAPAEPAGPPREIVVRMSDEPSPEKPGTIEVVLEPLVALAPAEPVPAPLVGAAEPAPALEPEPEFDVSDLVDYVPAREQFFDFIGTAPAAAPLEVEPEPVPEPQPEPAVAPIEPAQPQDDYVFRAPPPEEPEYAPPPPQDEAIPVEEVPLEAEAEEQAQWAPPTEETPAPQLEEEVIEMEIVEEDDEVVEMEILDDVAESAIEPPALTGKGELYRLRGFDAGAEGALAKIGITEITHLSGHDAGELAQRANLPLSRVQPWVQVADLVHEVGVPVDAAIALVAAGVAGPRGLRDGDVDEIADRVAAFGGYSVKAGDVKRWKRRA